MDEKAARPVTYLLQAWSSGDKGALTQLVPAVYGELRKLARRRMAVEQGSSLEPTALVNELYLRLVEIDGLDFHNRLEFFALAAQIMRHILVDAARARATSKRGGQKKTISFEERYFATPGRDREIVALDDALEALAKKDSRKARAVELRFFGGLSMEETAEVMGISLQTVRRDWDFSRAWLARTMSGKEVGRA